MAKNSDEKNKNLCAGCSLCCEYVCVEMDKPTTKYEYDQIFWLVLHKNVWVYIGTDKKWYVQFNTPCEKLGDNHLCKDYQHRPNICRNHMQDSCEKYGVGSPYKELFTNKKQFMKYLKKNKIDYNFKNFKH